MQEADARNLRLLGTAVIVRTYGGTPRVARIISITDEAAFVSAPEYFDAIASGDRDPPMIGFPISDVFELDEGIFARIAESRDWRLAQPFTARL